MINISDGFTNICYGFNLKLTLIIDIVSYRR